MTRMLIYIYIRMTLYTLVWPLKIFMVMAMASGIFLPLPQSKGTPSLWRRSNFSPSWTQLRKFSRLQAWELESGNAIMAGILAVDPWAPGSSLDSQSVASTLFAASLFPYLGFLYHLTKSGTAPKLTLFGFYFLLAFVGATIPAGIYAKIHYGTSLSNVDWLHGSAESLLTLTNLFIVFGLRKALRESKQENEDVVSEDLID